MRLLRPVLGLAVLAAIVAVASAGAANSVTYQDSVGEGGGDPGFADMSRIDVSNDDAGMITIKITLTNRPVFARDTMIQLFFDTDNNTATGEAGVGTEYVIQLLLGEIALFRWDGVDRYSRTAGDPPATSLVYSWTGGVVTIRISAAELGNTKRFRFAALTVGNLVINDVTGEIDDTNAKVDIAPAAGGGLFLYDVKIAPARLVFKSLKTAPASPKAGGTFTVRMAATRSDTKAAIVNGRVDCVAKAGARSVQPTSERFAGGQAVCVFKIPVNAAGKTIRGTITIVFEGKRLVRPFSAKIR